MNEALLKGIFRTLKMFWISALSHEASWKGAKIQKVPKKSAENRDVFFVIKFDRATGIRGGTGRAGLKGVYAQGNAPVVPIFNILHLYRRDST